MLLNHCAEQVLNIVHVGIEEGAGEPCDAVDGHDGHHSRLPHVVGHGILGFGPADDDHQGSCRDEDDLNDEMHLDGDHLLDGNALHDDTSRGQGFGRYGLARGQQHVLGTLYRHHLLISWQYLLGKGEDDNQRDGGEEDIDSILRLLADLLVEHGQGIAIDKLVLSGVGQSGLELRVFVEVESAACAPESGHHDAHEAAGDGDGHNLRNGDLEAIERGDGGESHDGSRDG